MRYFRLMLLLLSIAVLLSIPIVLASCGGGGSSGSPPPGVTYVNSKATGTYQYIIIANGFSAETGTAVFDGAGNGTWTAIQTSGTETSGTFTYTVTSDNAMTLDGTMIGTMRSGGNFFVLNQTVSGEEGMLIAVKLSSGMTDTANIYVGGQFSFDTLTPRSSTQILQIAMHDTLASELTWSVVSGPSGTGDYTFNADGSFSLPMTSPNAYGAISSDYDLMILGDGESASDDYMNAIFAVKSATTATWSTLSGTYIIHEFMDDDVMGVGAFVTSRGWVTFDGSGNGTYTELANSSGPVTPGTDNFTYVVNNDGTFLISAGPDTIDGVVLQDGSVFGLIDPDPTTNNNVSVAIGVRK